MAVFLIYLLPMVLPSVIYALWRLWRARRPAAVAPSSDGSETADVGAAEAEAEIIDWRAAPWLWLLIAGAALLTLVLVTGVFTEGARDEGRYVPPRMENGRIVPGEMRPEQAPVAPRPNDPSSPR